MLRLRSEDRAAILTASLSMTGVQRKPTMGHLEAFSFRRVLRKLSRGKITRLVVSGLGDGANISGNVSHLYLSL